MNSITKETDLDSPTKKTWTWLSSRIISKHVNKNSIQNMIKARCTYVSFLMTIGQTSLFFHSWRRRAAHARRRRRRAVLLMQRRRMEAIEQSRRALSKNLIRPLPVQDRWGRRFWRPALPIAVARQRSGGSRPGGEKAKPRCVCGLFESCGGRRIYRENRVGLGRPVTESFSLLNTKQIRSKNKLQKEAVAFASPCPARQGAVSERVFLPFSSSSHTSND